MNVKAASASGRKCAMTAGSTRAEAAEMAHARHIADGVGLPGEPFSRLPALLFGCAVESACDAGEVIQDHVRLHDGQAAVAQHRHLRVAVDRQMFRQVLRARLEIDRPNENGRRASVRNSIGL